MKPLTPEQQKEMREMQARMAEKRIEKKEHQFQHSIWTKIALAAFVILFILARIAFKLYHITGR